MEAVGAVVVVLPAVTPPGLTQLEVMPLEEKVFRVPLNALVVASVNTVVVKLLRPAEPWLK